MCAWHTCVCLICVLNIYICMHDINKKYMFVLYICVLIVMHKYTHIYLYA